GIVGVIELGDQVVVVAAGYVLDLLEPLVLRIWEIEVIRRSAARIEDLAQAVRHADIGIGEGAELVHIGADPADAVERPGFAVGRAINRTVGDPAKLIVAERDGIVRQGRVDAGELSRAERGRHRDRVVTVARRAGAIGHGYDSI